MADVKISELTAQASANVDVSADVLALVDTSATQTKKISVENLLSPITIDKSAGTITSLGTIAGNVVINNASNPTYLQIGSSLADDPYMVFQSDGNTFAMGIDRSDSNRFKISDNATLGTNDRFEIDATGLNIFKYEGAENSIQIHSGVGSSTTGVSQIYFSSKDEHGGNTHQSYIKSTIDGTSSTSATKMSFHNRDSGGTVQEYLTIKADGKTGFGTNDPRNTIHSTGIVEISNASSNSDTERIRFGRTDDNQRYSSIFHKLSDSAANNFITFKMHNGSSQIDALKISGDGKIGIGDSSPDALLSIKGDSDGGTTPSIRLKDGSDTREAWISNYSGDLVIANGGDDNVPHCKIQMYDGNLMSFFTSNTERFNVDYNGTFVIKESTGDPDSTKLYLQSTKTYTDDEYENFDIAGRGAIVTVAVTTSGNQRSGLFFIDTASITVIKVADPSDDFAASDTDNKICVYKGSGNSNTFSVKNRKGGDRAISVGIIATGA